MEGIFLLYLFTNLISASNTTGVNSTISLDSKGRVIVQVNQTVFNVCPSYGSLLHIHNDTFATLLCKKLQLGDIGLAKHLALDATAHMMNWTRITNQLDVEYGSTVEKDCRGFNRALAVFCTDETQHKFEKSIHGAFVRKTATIDGETVFQCEGLNETYRISAELTDNCYFTHICSGEVGMRYQSCGCPGVRIVQGECRGMICEQSDGSPDSFTYTSVPSRRICDGHYHCADRMDESNCAIEYTYGGGVNCTPSEELHNGFVPRLYFCDSYSDCKYGEDELNCGFDFGIECVINETNSTGWVDRKHICEGVAYCKDGADEDVTLCQERNKTMLKCRERGTDRLVDIKEKDTCYYPYSYSYSYPQSYSTTITGAKFPGCQGLIDQTNCTSTNVFKCTVDGNINTRIRDRWLCNNLKECDDGQDEDCVSISEDCTIHKHMICDGIREEGCKGEDEKGCDEMFTDDVFCERLLTRNQTRKLKVLKQWICDGVKDCMDGIDEDNSVFKCRQGIECPDIPSVFVTKDKLCDGFESCAGSESQLCMATRLSPQDFHGGVTTKNNDTTVLEITPKAISPVKRYEFQFPCLPGIMKTNNLQMPSVCSKEDLDEIKPSGRYAVNRYWWRDCHLNTWVSKVRGLREIFCTLESNKNQLMDTSEASCTNDVMIKQLKTVNKNILEKYLLYGDDTMAEKVFTCKNGKCIQPGLLCNSYDDCGDGSEEIECPYFYKCRKGFPQTVSSRKVCDNVFDCSDGSDECSLGCGSDRLLRIAGLRHIAMIIGITSFLMNTYTVFHGTSMFVQCSSKTLRVNHFFMILIGIGDWSMGLYLVILASTDIHYGDEYCTVRYEWLTSRSCSFLGALSTFGSSLSVFTMVIVSFYRASKVTGFRFSKNVEVYGSIGAGIFCATIALVISVIPLTPQNRDYFSNGLWYKESNLFPTLADMNNHMQFITKYKEINGDTSTVERKWADIEKYIANLFINDDPPKGKQQRFYGNDPVCLFKYFVRNSDPQYSFSLLITAIDFACFIIICVCYTYIVYIMKKDAAENGMVKNQSRKRSQKKIQIKLMAIILTDISTWIPFCILTWMFAKGVDISKDDIYQIAAVFLLPINSIMNPMIYNEFLSKFKWALNTLTSGHWSSKSTLQIRKPNNQRENMSVSSRRKISSSCTSDSRATTKINETKM